MILFIIGNLILLLGGTIRYARYRYDKRHGLTYSKSVSDPVYLIGAICFFAGMILSIIGGYRMWG